MSLVIISRCILLDFWWWSVSFYWSSCTPLCATNMVAFESNIMFFYVFYFTHTPDYTRAHTQILVYFTLQLLFAEAAHIKHNSTYSLLWLLLTHSSHSHLHKSSWLCIVCSHSFIHCSHIYTFVSHSHLTVTQYTLTVDQTLDLLEYTTHLPRS